MIITAHQPAYLPWLGFFHKVILSDKLICLDEVQIATQSKENFVRRNKIKIVGNSLWLTIPTKDSYDTKIINTEIDYSVNWQKKHLRSIEFHYKKAPFFKLYYPQLTDFYELKWDKLSSMLVTMLKDFFFPALSISIPIVLASQLNIKDQGSDLILNICIQQKTDIYISGSLGKNYLDQKSFKTQGIKIYYQKYNHPIYPQLWGDFIPYLSVLDLLFNMGPKSKDIIMSGNKARNDLKSLRV